MFDQYSYKYKFRALLILFVMLSIAAYRRSFSSLASSFKENNNLNRRIEVLNSKSNDINELQSEISVLDKMIGKQDASKEKIQQEIVNFLFENSSHLSINEMQTVHEFTDGNYTIYTYQLDLLGSYNELIRVTYEFEKKFDYCKIVSLKFYSDKKNNKSEVLHLKIIFQKYENNK